MNLDAENRLLPDGEYREATNIVVINNEIGEEGSVRKSFSNKRLTNLSFGANPITLGSFSYSARNKIYWLVVSDTGSYLVEYDSNSQTSTFILKDTRPIGQRVFDLRKECPCTGINIIPHEDPKRELFLMTDNNMEPLCINIERAKGYGENGFEKDDIYLIKKAPAKAPTVSFLRTPNEENNIEERFLSFFYRYKYLDGEFSRFSTFTNYKFIPGVFSLDFETFENLGMVNSFNTLRIGFNTGDKRVVEVQVLFKNSNSNTPYLIEKFDKKQNGWGDNETKHILFNNNKIYSALPEKELFRTFDNVPLCALAQTVIGNKVLYGNYKEGYNLIDKNNNSIAVDFNVGLKTTSLGGARVQTNIETGSFDDNTLKITFSGQELSQGKRLSFIISLKEKTDIGGDYSQTLDFILNRDYLNAGELAEDEDFLDFLSSLTGNFALNREGEEPDDSTISQINGFEVSAFTANTISIKAPTIVYTIDDTPDDNTDDDTSEKISFWSYVMPTSVLYYDNDSSSSVKSNRSYEGALLYEDAFGRKSTALTSLKNTIYVNNSLAPNKNQLTFQINSLPPKWAKKYKILIKSEPLSYQTIYASIFFEDGVYRWVKLEGESRDKVKEGEWLIIKKDIAGPVDGIIKVKVLEVVSQPENFISGNNNDLGSEIKEPAGKYMKIKSGSFYLDYNKDDFIYDVANGGTANNRPFTRTDGLYRTNDDGTYSDIPISQGSTITLKFNSFAVNRTDSGPYIFEKSYVVQQDYDSFEEWFTDNINLPLDVPNSELSYSNVDVVRGIPFGNNGITVTGNPDDPLFLRVEGLLAGNGSRKGYLKTEVSIRLLDGFVIFETEPKQADIDIYYETEEDFDIVDGFHTGNIQDQDDVTPALIESSFFNCYSQGNGAESYRIKDAVNKNFLNVDFKPTAVDPSGYQEIRRSADLTYSEAFIESSNINGLNVFNLSTANFKDDLDKQYGSIQKLHSRQNDVLVLQEEKSGKVLFDKDAIYTADGNAALTSIPGILGQWIPYQGNRGIGKNPESFSIDDDGRIKYASVRNGSIVRLSLDGIEDIIYGLKTYFRNLFIDKPNARIISGYDPYLDQTVFSIGEEPERLPLFNCENEIIKSGQDGQFKYNLQLNNLGGDIVFSYNITSGTATIIVEFNGNSEVVSAVSGSGTIVVNRDSLIENIATVTIIPVTETISYSILNNCPVGTELEIVMVVLNDLADSQKTITNRFKTITSSFISSDDIFNDGPVTRFESISGIEGIDAFPKNGQLVNMQAFKDSINSGKFEIGKCNRLGYLISSLNYTSADYQAILDNPDTQFLTVSEIGEEGFSSIASANFIFNRSSIEQKLYMIWDYTDRNPVLNDDNANVNIGQTVVIDVLGNDEINDTVVVEIETEPNYGTAIVNPDNTISYTHDGSQNFVDSFIYKVTVNGCSSTATVNINIGISCGDSLTVNGNVGIYEVMLNFGTETGYAGIRYNAQTVPDRFELFWNGNKVADSKYVGNGLTGTPPGYAGLLGDFTLNVFEYDGSAFVDTGNDENITVTQDDIANGTTEPTAGVGLIYFLKNTPLPANVLLRVTGPVGGTAWGITNIICPQSEIPT